jgi:hypothetical protein
MINIEQKEKPMRRRTFIASSVAAGLPLPALATPPLPIPHVITRPRLDWDRLKAELLVGDDLTHNQDGSENLKKRDMVEIVLDNTIRELQQPDLSDTDVERLANVVLPVTRRAMANLIAFEIIGVQPMKAVVDHIWTLHTRDNPRRLRILKEVVAAKTRRLAARWEENGHPTDEMIDALAAEVCTEFDQELLRYLHHLAGEPTVSYDHNEVAYELTFVGDCHPVLPIMIRRQATLISTRTRHGAGNWCVISPTALTILQSAYTGIFIRAHSHSCNGFQSSVKFVGMLSGMKDYMKVYVDPHADDFAPVLVGYRGSNIDAPCFFSPYVMMSGRRMLNPQNKPTMNFVTRYGFMTLDDEDNAADFFSTIGINPGLTFI